MASSTDHTRPDTVAADGEGMDDARSRRDVIRGLAAAAAGAIAGGVLSAKEAEADHGTLNPVSSSGAPAIHAQNTAGGSAMVAESSAPFIAAVDGSSSSGTGVVGNSLNGIGVEGFSAFHIGVSAAGPIALQVEGRAVFSTAGSGSILSNQDSASVSVSRVTALSHVTVTLTGDPGQAGSLPGFKPVVVWVETPARDWIRGPHGPARTCRYAFYVSGNRADDDLELEVEV